MTPDSIAPAVPRLAAGVFLVSMATILYELLLTRVFSVTMWYHFAFVAISVAMFGMTAGALYVHFKPAQFTSARVARELARSAILFAVSLPLAFLAHLAIPFQFTRTLTGLFTVLLFCTIISIPFFWSGVSICLALTRFPAKVTSLYAADLAGAAAGAVTLVLLLRVMDGVSAVFAAAAIAGVAGLVLAPGGTLRRASGVVLGLLVALTLGNAMGVRGGLPVFRLQWVKGGLERPALWERWNSYSRIRVEGDSSKPSEPLGWGFSPAYARGDSIRQLVLNIDSYAATPITAFSGDLSSVVFLKHDIVNVAHFLSRPGKVLVVGTGGGRDVLSALAFGHREVVGVEINAEIMRAVNGEFGAFTGHLDKWPGVRIVNDEARSYLSRSDERYDVIQVSLIDTWAATASGAFVLAENALYTTEAWGIFHDRLAEDGLLTFSRWYFYESPNEIYRMASIARAMLEAKGVAEPWRHVVILQGPAGLASESDRKRFGVGTLILSRQPFTAADLGRIGAVADSERFRLVASPVGTGDDVLQRLLRSEDWRVFAQGFDYNIEPTTDDSPYFFNMLRFGRLTDRAYWGLGANEFNMKAVATLAFLLVAVSLLALGCILVPWVATRPPLHLGEHLAHLVYFAGIGVGFMLVEVSQLQRFIVFLGHPTYSLTTVLATLLLSSGIGSFMVGRLTDESLPAVGASVLLAVIVVQCAYGLAAPALLGAFAGFATPVRIALAALLLAPLGLALGTAFPMGMRLALRAEPRLGPWMWAVNGATSVVASVLAIALALAFGVSRVYWTGVACYLVCLLAMFATTRSAGRAAQA